MLCSYVTCSIAATHVQLDFKEIDEDVLPIKHLSEISPLGYRVFQGVLYLDIGTPCGEKGNS